MTHLSPVELLDMLKYCIFTFKLLFRPVALKSYFVPRVPIIWKKSPTGFLLFKFSLNNSLAIVQPKQDSHEKWCPLQHRSTVFLQHLLFLSICSDIDQAWQFCLIHMKLRTPEFYVWRLFYESKKEQQQHHYPHSLGKRCLVEPWEQSPSRALLQPACSTCAKPRLIHLTRNELIFILLILLIPQSLAGRRDGSHQELRKEWKKIDMGRMEVLRVPRSECSEYTEGDKLLGSISPASSFPSRHLLLFSHLIPANQKEKGTLSEPFQLSGCSPLPPSAPTHSRYVAYSANKW